jgi:hypothetical protein
MLIDRLWRCVISDGFGWERGRCLMGSLIEELQRREAAARREADELRSDLSFTSATSVLSCPDSD